MEPRRVLSAGILEQLARAVERGTLTPPFSSLQLQHLIAKTDEQAAAQVLGRLHASGLRGANLAAALLFAAEVKQVEESRARPSLVWSDLDLHGSRDTGVVCKELFSGAQRSVLVSTYNLGHKAKADHPKGNPVLKPLATRMDDLPELQVRLFVNLRRLEHFSHAPDTEIESSFVEWFRKELWPWDRVPEVYYDPRSIHSKVDDSACLHAKCVTVDDQRAFVTSANLTEAAHERNIEAGVLIDDPLFAQALRLQFESLIDRRYVRRLRGLS